MVNADSFAGVAAFVHVAEALSFRRGAAALGVTPAAVSKAINRLETHLGVTLFDRSSRHVALTPEGALYLVKCRAALDQLRAGRELLAEQTALTEGAIRVSVSPVMGRLVLGQLPRFAEQYPQLDVQLGVTDRYADLVKEELDLAVRIGALEDSKLVSKVLARPRWVTIASPHYLARRGTPQSVRALEGHDAVQFLTPAGVVRNFEFSSRSGDARRPSGMRRRLVIDNGDVLVDAAIAGLGVAQVFDFMVRDHLQRGALVALLDDRALNAPPVRAVWLPRRQPLPKVRVFLQFLEDVFRTR